MLRKILIAALAGLGLGYGSAFTFFTHSWTAIIAWGIAGAIVGAFAADGKQAIWMGGAFGAALAISFLLGVFGGTADKLPSYFVLVLVMLPVGALGGIVSAWVGHAIRRRVG